MYRCPRCGGPLELVYEKGKKLPDPVDLVGCRDGIWCFSHMLPGYSLRVSLGEGMTRARLLRMGGKRIWAKLELQNPTGSFKDRGAALAVSMAFSQGSRIVVEDSSGNAGAATSCYASSQGVKPVIVVPSGAPKGKLDLLRLCGAEIVVVGSRDEAAVEAPRIALKRGGAYVPHTWLPHHVEAMKTVAFEIHYQLPQLPDAVFVPTSSGTLLLGLYRGFKELVDLGYRDRVPRLFPVQTTSFHPLYKALKGSEVEGEEENLADGISLRAPPRLDQMVSAVKESRGDAIIVDNARIRAAARELISQGILAEPTSAVSLAGLETALEQGLYFEDPLIVVTGSGLKMVERLLGLFS